jgi:hypothetical protein
MTRSRVVAVEAGLTGLSGFLREPRGRFFCIIEADSPF